jgi:hypothetical protein
VVGIDLNPVAWFIVKTEVEPVDLDDLQVAFDRLAERPVAWNRDRPLRETLLGLYKTEVEEGIDADVIYTFWVKHAVCTDPNCGREVPLFKDYIIARKAPSVRYHPDAACPQCDINQREVELFIRRILTSKANELDACNLGWVQMVFRRPLRRADDFWFEAGGRMRVSLRPIFGSPMKETDVSGNEYYLVGFNLT